MPDYSGTPLVKKLGIKPGFRLLFHHAPSSFANTHGPLPGGTRFFSSRARNLDLVLLFAKSQQQLREPFKTLSARLAPAGMLWAAWPKKTSGVLTDLTFAFVQRIGLATGLVDTKICAIDETWSGLRFVIRTQDRGSRSGRP